MDQTCPVEKQTDLAGYKSSRIRLPVAVDNVRRGGSIVTGHQAVTTLRRVLRGIYEKDRVIELSGKQTGLRSDIFDTIVIHHHPEIEIAQCVSISPAQGAKQPRRLHSRVDFQPFRDGPEKLVALFQILIKQRNGFILNFPGRNFRKKGSHRLFPASNPVSSVEW